MVNIFAGPDPPWRLWHRSLKLNGYREAAFFITNDSVETCLSIVNQSTLENSGSTSPLVTDQVSLRYPGNPQAKIASVIATTSGIIFIPFLVARSVELLFGTRNIFYGRWNGWNGWNGWNLKGVLLTCGRFSDFCFVNYWVSFT